jgi:hypothetical protein
LLLVDFDVNGTMDFCEDIAGKNYERVRYCCTAVNSPKPIQLFKVAIASGIVIGAQAERFKNGHQ